VIVWKARESVSSNHFSGSMRGAVSDILQKFVAMCILVPCRASRKKETRCAMRLRCALDSVCLTVPARRVFETLAAYFLGDLIRHKLKVRVTTAYAEQTACAAFRPAGSVSPHSWAYAKGFAPFFAAGLQGDKRFYFAKEMFVALPALEIIVYFLYWNYVWLKQVKTKCAQKRKRKHFLTQA